MITKLDDGSIIIEGDSIGFYHLLTLQSALKLELLGFKHSQGSIYAHVKKNYNLKGNKQKVYDQFSALVEEAKKNQENS